MGGRSRGGHGQEERGRVTGVRGTGGSRTLSAVPARHPTPTGAAVTGARSGPKGPLEDGPWPYWAPQPILLATAAVSPKHRSEQVSPMHRPPVGWLLHPLGQGLRGYGPGAHCCPASPHPPQAGAFTCPRAFPYPLPPA